MEDIDAADRQTQCLDCQVGDCDLLALDYPWCAGCQEHHRRPVAGPGERCPVDLMTERWDRNEAAGREHWDDGPDFIDIAPRELPPA